MKLLLIGLLSATALLANGGHDHGQAPAQPPAAVRGRTTASAQTELFEVVVRADPFLPGSATRATIFLSEFTTNRPVAGAAIDLEVLTRSSRLKASARSAATPGVYEADLPFPSEGTYDIEMTIRTGDEGDLLVLTGLRVAGRTK